MHPLLAAEGDRGWRAWHRVTRAAATALGVSLAEVGEMRVTEVLRALHAREAEDAEDAEDAQGAPREGVDCAACGGLALETDARGYCSRCAAWERENLVAVAVDEVREGETLEEATDRCGLLPYRVAGTGHRCGICSRVDCDRDHSTEDEAEFG